MPPVWRRFGFHGLSYAYLMDELRRSAGNADSRMAAGVILGAGLGNGRGMAAVKDGKPIDTTMGFTPTAGLVMGTRPGDLDPGMLVYLMRVEKMTPEQMDEFLSHECGLKGISETSSDMRDLTTRAGTDIRAAEAVELFCYRARQWIGALAAAMGGVDTLVFSGGIGEHAPDIRAGVCAGLEFLGITVDTEKNGSNAGVISSDEAATATIRVIATDEEIAICAVSDQDPGALIRAPSDGFCRSPTFSRQIVLPALFLLPACAQVSRIHRHDPQVRDSRWISGFEIPVVVHRHFSNLDYESIDGSTGKPSSLLIRCNLACSLGLSLPTSSSFEILERIAPSLTL